MKRTVKNKVGKFVLTGALALGGIGAIDLFQPQETQHSASAATLSAVDEVDNIFYSYDPNVLKVSTEVLGNSSSMTDFETKHTATFTIQNSSGVTVQRGTLNRWQRQAMIDYNHEYRQLTNISTSSLTPGHYRITVSIPMDDGFITSATTPSLTNHFYKDTTGNLSQFSK